MKRAFVKALSDKVGPRIIIIIIIIYGMFPLFEFISVLNLLKIHSQELVHMVYASRTSPLTPLGNEIFPLPCSFTGETSFIMAMVTEAESPQGYMNLASVHKHE